MRSRHVAVAVSEVRQRTVIYGCTSRVQLGTYTLKTGTVSIEGVCELRVEHWVEERPKCYLRFSPLHQHNLAYETLP